LVLSGTDTGFLTAGVWLSLKKAQEKGVSNEGSLFFNFVVLLIGIIGWR